MPPQKSQLIGWLIRAGYDFPADIERLLDWELCLIIQREVGDKTTRGELKYSDNTFGRKYGGRPSLSSMKQTYEGCSEKVSLPYRTVED